ncbi:inner centromere protein A-like [Wyeomyia smithii]|uniref:inner centromere protein A-like n=1 Tax=Wyeomyia smithii TaxID=174621 RepID=UPI00246812A1|nr:inner centromere protein A-like [Wyeomyia smithii]
MSDLPRESDPRSTAEREILDLTATPCGICGPSTCDEQMICCDSCMKWFHSRCVGVAEDSIPEKWYCQSKACQQQAQEYQKQYKEARKQARGKKTPDEFEKSSSTLRKSTSSVEQRMKELEERQKRQNEELEAEMRLQQMEKRMQREFEKKKLEMEIKLRAEEEEERRALQEEILQKKKMQIERMRANQRSFEQQMADLDKELNELSVIKTSKVIPALVEVVGGASIESKEKLPRLSGANINKPAEEEDTDDDFEDDYDEDSDRISQRSNPFSEGETSTLLQKKKEESLRAATMDWGRNDSGRRRPS